MILSAQRAACCQLIVSITHLFANICVAAPQQLLNLIAQIARHFLGSNVRKCAQGETDGVHVGVVHVADVSAV